MKKTKAIKVENLLHIRTQTSIATFFVTGGNINMNNFIKKEDVIGDKDEDEK